MTILNAKKEIAVVQECPMCGALYDMYVEEEKYDRWKNREDLIQNIFDELNACEREFLKTGYCLTCQELLFGVKCTSDKIHAASLPF